MSETQDRPRVAREQIHAANAEIKRSRIRSDKKCLNQEKIEPLRKGYGGPLSKSIDNLEDFEHLWISNL
jgi:hypothetical protein